MGREAHGDLLESLAQRFADRGKHLGASFAQLIFGERRDARNGLARLLIEIGDRGQHPLIRYIFKAVAMQLCGVIAQFLVGRLHLVAMRVHSGLP